jgi:glycosyltransferase involved in cell wall biosynthesis
MADRRILACIPYFNCKRYVRRAVDSLLTQTHRELTVLVVNDGDPDPPWDALAGIRDPRLVRYSSNANHGPYFTLAAALDATTAPYLLIQDADDWSDPRRAALLLEMLQREGTDLAVSAQPQYVEQGNGVRLVETRWAAASCSTTPPRFTLTRSLGQGYAYRVPHAGLFRSAALHRVGGYHAGFRVGYDTLLTNLLLMTGRVSHTPLPLYHRLLRPQSLTHSSSTGTGSAEALAAQNAIATMYKYCFERYEHYLAGMIDSEQLAEAVRGVVKRGISAADAADLFREAQRMRKILQEAGVQ